jgi:hypothetical protein
MDTTPRPAPKPLADLSRSQIAGRVHALRRALDLLVDQHQRDGGESYRCRGTMKKELVVLEQRLFQMDHPESAHLFLVPMAAALEKIGRAG